MAKRKFGLSSTLNRNKKEELPQDLPAKRPLPSKSKDIEAVEQKVDSIHRAEQQSAAAGSATSKASATKVAEKPKRAATDRKKTSPKKVVGKRKTVKDSDMRLTFDIPRSLHKKLKLKAINQDRTIKDYLIKMIERELR